MEQIDVMWTTRYNQMKIYRQYKSESGFVQYTNPTQYTLRMFCYAYTIVNSPII